MTKKIDKSIKILQAILRNHRANLNAIRQSASKLNELPTTTAQVGAAVGELEQAAAVLTQKSSEVAEADAAVKSVLNQGNPALVQQAHQNLQQKVAEAEMAVQEVKAKETEMDKVAVNQSPEAEGFFKRIKKNVKSLYQNHGKKIAAVVILTGAAVLAYKNQDAIAQMWNARPANTEPIIPAPLNPTNSTAFVPEMMPAAPATASSLLPKVPFVPTNSTALPEMNLATLAPATASTLLDKVPFVPTNSTAFPEINLATLAPATASTLLDKVPFVPETIANPAPFKPAFVPETIANPAPFKVPFVPETIANPAPFKVPFVPETIANPERLLPKVAEVQKSGLSKAKNAVTGTLANAGKTVVNAAGNLAGKTKKLANFLNPWGTGGTRRRTYRAH